MRRIYFIERRVYSLKSGEPTGSYNCSIWGHKVYSSFDSAHESLVAIKNLRNRKYEYVPEVEDARVVGGEVKWPEINILEHYRICSLPVSEVPINE